MYVYLHFVSSTQQFRPLNNVPELRLFWHSAVLADICVRKQSY